MKSQSALRELTRTASKHRWNVGTGIALERLLTEAEVLELLRISRPKLRSLVKQGLIRPIMFMRHRRYSRQDIVDFLDAARRDMTVNED